MITTPLIDHDEYLYGELTTYGMRSVEDYASPLTMDVHKVIAAIDIIWEGLKSLVLLRDPKWVTSVTDEGAEDALAEECLCTEHDLHPVRGVGSPRLAEPPMGGRLVKEQPAPPSTESSHADPSAVAETDPSTQAPSATTTPEGVAVVVAPQDPPAAAAPTESTPSECSVKSTKPKKGKKKAAPPSESESEKSTGSTRSSRGKKPTPKPNAPPPGPPDSTGTGGSPGADQPAKAAFYKDVEPVMVEKHRRVKHKEPFIRALVEEVKCKLGRPTRSQANVLVVRRILHNRCVELKVRPRDSQRAIAIALELVFTPDEAEVNAAELRHSWAAKVRRAKLWYANQSAVFRYVCPKSFGIWGAALLGVNLSNEVA